jgi:hypothetical protein
MEDCNFIVICGDAETSLVVTWIRNLLEGMWNAYKQG